MGGGGGGRGGVREREGEGGTRRWREDWERLDRGCITKATHLWGLSVSQLVVRELCHYLPQEPIIIMYRVSIKSNIALCFNSQIHSRLAATTTTKRGGKTEEKNTKKPIVCKVTRGLKHGRQFPKNTLTTTADHHHQQHCQVLRK